MPSKGYVTIALPKIIVEQVEELIKDESHGYISKPEFIKEAIREKIRDIKKKIEVVHEIVDFFVLDLCCKPKFCTRLLEPQKVAPNVKRCSKVSEHNRERPNPDDWGYLSQPRLIKRTELVHTLYRIYRLVSI